MGRLGSVYARDLSSRIACTRLTAIADTDSAALDRVRGEFDVPHAYVDSADLFRDPSVDAVVIVAPTNTHREVAMAAAAAGKPTFLRETSVDFSK